MNRNKIILAYTSFIVTGIIGIVGIFYITESTLRVFFGGGGIASATGIFYVFIIKIPAVQKAGSILIDSLGHLGKASRLSVAWRIQSTLNEYRNTLNKETHDLLPEADIEWVTEDKVESFFDEYKGKVIIRLNRSEDRAQNLAKATLMQVSNGVIPSTRMYIDNQLNTSIDFTLVKKILIEKNERESYRYFMNEIMLPELADDEIVSYLESIEEIDGKGLFTRLFLRELKELPIVEGLQLSNNVEIQHDVNSFFKFTKSIANREPSQDVPLEYNGKIIKTSVIIVARRIKMGTLGMKPYIKRALQQRKWGSKIIFLLAYDHAIDFTKDILNVLVNRHGMKLVKNTDEEFEIDGKQYLCSTLVAYNSVDNEDISVYDSEDEPEVLVFDSSVFPNGLENDPFMLAPESTIDVENNADSVESPSENGEMIQGDDDSIGSEINIESLIEECINETCDQSGWAFLGDIGTLLRQKNPSFKLYDYGYHKMRPFIRSLDIFEVQERIVEGKPPVTYIRIRN